MSEENTISAVVYSKDSCPYCVHAKKLLDLKEIPYTEVNVMAGTTEEIEAKRADLIKLVTNVTGKEPKTLPQIFLNGEYVGGFDQLKAKLS